LELAQRQLLTNVAIAAQAHHLTTFQPQVAVVVDLVQ
jgi:hypothetical protein